jgi:Zn-dependent protease with chaperone function
VSITQTPVPALCPQCHSRLADEGGELPWCERCEWNLAFRAPDPALGRFTDRQERWAHRIGYRLDADLFTKLSGHPLTRPGTTAVSAALTAVSVLVIGILLGLAVGGLWLVVAGPFLPKLIGVIMIGCAVLCRPRLGRVAPLREKYDELSRTGQPELFALIDRVAAAAGAPVPDLVLLSPEWGASAAVLGLRRRRVLTLGLPLWSSLRPQERVVLLAHELGHFVNNDHRRSLRTQPALAFFGDVAELLSPLRRFVEEDDEAPVAAFARLGQSALGQLLWPAARAAWLVHVLLHVLGARDAQRAEYHADDTAARIGGTTATGSLMDVAACGHLHRAVVGSRARGGARAAGWREAVEQTRAALEPRLGRLRQLTRRRDASPFSSHPPAGLRHRMAVTQPYRSAQVVLTEAAAERLDAELAGFEEGYRRIIAASW